MITGDTIKSAIAIKLSKAYPAIPIYKEKIPQGTERPYFSIRQLDLAQDKISKEKYNRLYQEQISYYSNIDDLQLYTNLDTKGNELLELLKTINVGVGDDTTSAGGLTQPAPLYPVVARQANYKIVEDVLQVIISYPIKVYVKPEPSVLMGSLKIIDKPKI